MRLASRVDPRDLRRRPAPPGVHPKLDDMPLRSCELRLSKALRRIVALALAPVPLAAACHGAGESDPHADASVDPPDATSEQLPDASLDQASDTTSPDVDEASCAPTSFDGGGLDDGADGCSDFWLLPCGVTKASLLSACFPSGSICKESCGDGGLFYCQLASVTCTGDGVLDPDAAAVVECVRCAVGGGRRPRGLCDVEAPRSNPLGDCFASMAHLESASVRAFRDLSGWLDDLGAPPSLARAAQRARRDEHRHARAAARLARRFGSTPPRVRVRRVPSPSLAELIEDTAVEGCIGETFGALLAAWQAEHAADARVRRTMRAIARDEARHAALAWEIWRWGMTRLPEADRTHMRRVLDDAFLMLVHRAPSDVPAIVQRVAGHPAPAVARRLTRALAAVVAHEAARAT
ncbi:putative lipoprotein [Minicystis rosea]|nr:putative lipoprotein [Minicystis rosea]